PSTLDVDVDHLDLHLLADLEDRLRRVDVFVADLGDVDQALDALRDADERPEGNELRHGAGDYRARLRGPLELLPRVLLRGLERQRDALPVEVDVEDLDLDLLPDRDDLLRMIDVLPRQLRDVHEPVHAAEIDERSEVDDRADRPLASLALLQRLQERLATLGL